MHAGVHLPSHINVRPPRTFMKYTTIGLMLVLFTSACSHKIESTPTPTSGSSTPQFSITPADVASTSIELVVGRVPSSPTQEVAVVHLEFSSAKAAEFRQFTKDHLNQRVQISVGTNVAEERVIRAESSSPRIEMVLSSPGETRFVAESLSWGRK
jgi:hypothetical protein